MTVLEEKVTWGCSFCSDVHSQLWGFQGLSVAVKAWIVNAAPGQGILRSEAWVTFYRNALFELEEFGSLTIDGFISQMSNFRPVTFTVWTRGALLTVALVAVVTIFSASQVE